ncbi:hypothetical protein [Silvanigrella aquatica]|uniref:Uncharacterized protein n=1 Tax=Silvanigrella aquatica TaxID=1915309 RepID=A0A1L4D381_9BACT|nr:hypothetical protein [Silvanigrella aquatica]APJ04647.1 hypothetical protein AXG55_12330 [Silvanigrella aquatica]
MALRVIVTLLSLIFMKIYANNFDISEIEESNWRGTYCSSYGDNLFYGNYNYNFKKNNQIETYIEYYSDYRCKNKSGQWNDIQTKGNYKIKNLYFQNEWVFYDLEVNLEHLNHPLFFQVKIKNNDMMICNESKRCSNYVKIK